MFTLGYLPSETSVVVNFILALCNELLSTPTAGVLRFVNLDNIDINTHVVYEDSRKVDISRFAIGGTNVYTAYVSIHNLFGMYADCLPITETLHSMQPKPSIGPYISLLNVFIVYTIFL